MNEQLATIPEFYPFSPRQIQVLSWWTEGSPYKAYNGIVADGSIRAGKTLCMSISFVMWASKAFNGHNFAFCGKTIASLRRNVITPLKPKLKGLGYKVDDKIGENCLIIESGRVKNHFYLFGGHDESSQDLVQGITLAGVMFDEVALQPESFVNQATGRCSVEGSKFWFNCNPSERLHWFKVRWINKYRERQLLYVHFTMDDNPSMSEKMRDRYRSMYVGMFYRRYILGQWCAAEGVIYDMFGDENLFDADERPWEEKAQAVRHYIGCDYGTTNPTVFLDIYDDGDTYWIAREYYHDSRAMQKQKTGSEYAADFVEFTEGDRSLTVIVDPAAEAFILQLKNKGYRVHPADNEVLEGIRMTATMIGHRKIRVDRRCKSFLRQIGSYVWDEKAAAHGEERPIKERDHAMDALRYVIKTTIKRRRLALYE